VSTNPNQAQMAIRTKLVGIVAGIIAALITSLVTTSVIHRFFSSNSVESQIAAVAKEMNRQLPKQVDQITRLDRVEAGAGKSYSYIYTVTVTGLTEQQKQCIIENTTRQALAAPAMQTIFAAGVTVWYKYYDSSGKKLYEFPVKK
jgi:hypothetical protein